MTLATTPPIEEFLENGVTLAHPVNFQFQASTDLVVSRIANAVETVLVLGTDYTVAGGAGSTGSITKSNGGVNGATLRIKRNTARSQSTDYTPGDDFPAESHEAALDRAMSIDQEQDVAIADLKTRALLFKAGQLVPELDRSAFAGKYWVGDASGNPVPAAAPVPGSDAALRADLALATGASLVKEAAGQTLQARIDQVFGKAHGTLPSGANVSLNVSRTANGAPDGTTQWYAEQKRIYAQGVNPFDFVRGHYLGVHAQGTGVVANGSIIHGYLWGEANATITNGAGIESHLRLDANAHVTNEHDCFNVPSATYGAGATVQRIVGLRVGAIGSAPVTQEAFGINVVDFAAASSAIAIRTEMTPGANKYAIFTGGGAQHALGGFVGINMTSAPQYPADVQGNLNNWVLNVTNAHATPFGARIRFNAAAPNNTTQEFFRCEDNVTTRLTIWSNGNVVNANNSYGAISDAKLKTDVREAGPQLADVLAMRLRKYKLIADGGDAKDLLGLVAQELEEVSPGLVFQTPDKEPYFEQAFERGGVGEPDLIPLIGVGQWKERETGTFTKGINYSVLNLKLLGAVQELHGLLEAQAVELGRLQRGRRRSGG